MASRFDLSLYTVPACSPFRLLPLVHYSLLLDSGDLRILTPRPKPKVHLQVAKTSATKSFFSHPATVHLTGSGRNIARGEGREKAVPAAYSPGSVVSDPRNPNLSVCRRSYDTWIRLTYILDTVALCASSMRCKPRIPSLHLPLLLRPRLFPLAGYPFFLHRKRSRKLAPLSDLGSVEERDKGHDGEQCCETAE